MGVDDGAVGACFACPRGSPWWCSLEWPNAFPCPWALGAGASSDPFRPWPWPWPRALPGAVVRTRSVVTCVEGAAGGAACGAGEGARRAPLGAAVYPVRVGRCLLPPRRECSDGVAASCAEGRPCGPAPSAVVNGSREIRDHPSAAPPTAPSTASARPGPRRRGAGTPRALSPSPQRKSRGRSATDERTPSWSSIGSGDRSLRANAASPTIARNQRFFTISPEFSTLRPGPRSVSTSWTRCRRTSGASPSRDPVSESAAARRPSAPRQERRGRSLLSYGPVGEPIRWIEGADDETGPHMAHAVVIDLVENIQRRHRTRLGIWRLWSAETETVETQM